MSTTPTVPRNDVAPPTWSLGDASLRPLREGDHLAWSAYLSDPRVTLHTSWGDTDVETIERIIRRNIAEYASGTSCRWAVANSEDTLVGTCGFSNWSLVHSHAELAYDLSPSYWRRGLMSRAVATVLEWAFGTAGFNRVHAFVMDTNAASIALLEGAGFTREGLLRQYRIARGTPRDFFLYARLREDSAAG